MDETTARAMIRAHFEAANVGAAGGGPGDDIARASEIYADDAVVEWPQGGERLRGKANIIGFRSTYPARQQFQLHRTTGCHDLWVNEYTLEGLANPPQNRVVDQSGTRHRRPSAAIAAKALYRLAGSRRARHRDLPAAPKPALGGSYPIARRSCVNSRSTWSSPVTGTSRMSGASSAYA
jgi:SnoaL-like domain